MSINIRELVSNDNESWVMLYQQYLQFYHTQLDEKGYERLWSWLMDDNENIYAYVATDENDTIIGLIHFREFIRPIKSARAIFIDDVFVDPDHRRQGIAQALFAKVDQFAKQHQCELLRWITAEDNYQAMHLYDKLAKKTSWLTYDRVI